MIYICTVHYRTESWIQSQLYYLNRNLRAEHRVFACVPPDRTRKDFYREVSFEPASTGSHNHADKLNYLAHLVGQEAADDDILVFLDGDAFPVRPLESFLEEKLKEFRLLAVQRRENLGDIQPHPSFAATKVGFWKALQGDWNPGFRWKNAKGTEVTDTGGNLLKMLTRDGAAWLPLLRTNTVDLHPLWFGIYGDLIYHHGAAYRTPTSRLDKASRQDPGFEYRNSPEFERIKVIRERVRQQIESDPEFWKQFVGES